MVLLDASAIIYLLEGDAAARRAAQRTLAALHGPGEPPTLAVSALSRLECRVRPLRDGDHDALGRYEAFFDDPGLIVIPLDTPVLDTATALRAEHRLRTPDALQAASLLANDPQGAFVTADRGFQRVPGLAVHLIAP